jgi:hypothetical protein
VAWEEILSLVRMETHGRVPKLFRDDALRAKLGGFSREGYYLMQTLIGKPPGRFVPASMFLAGGLVSARTAG